MLDRAPPATELGGDGFPESLSLSEDPLANPPPLLAPPAPLLPFTPLGPSEPLGIPDVGGVARLLRLEKVGENGGSDFWYWLMPDHSLPSTETGDIAPELPFIGGLRFGARKRWWYRYDSCSRWRVARRPWTTPVVFHGATKQ